MPRDSPVRWWAIQLDVLASRFPAGQQYVGRRSISSLAWGRPSPTDNHLVRRDHRRTCPWSARRIGADKAFHGRDLDDVVLGVPCVRLDLTGGELRIVQVTAATGATIDVVGTMDGDEAWIALRGKDLPDAALDELDAYFGQLFADFESERGADWLARGHMPPERIPHPVLASLRACMDIADAPWLHVAQGEATLYLLPFSDMDLLILEGKARRIMQDACANGLCQIKLAHIDLDQYRRWTSLLPQHVAAHAPTPSDLKGP